jgi:hypothetical protein
MRLSSRIILVWIIAAATAGCGLFGNAQDRAVRKSPSFRAGYDDGCAAANQQGADLRDRIRRDPTLYKTDDVYRAGWSNGFQTCRTTTTPLGASPGASPIPDPVPGSH